MEEQKQSLSPTPPKEQINPTTMDFPSALKEIIKGGKIHKLEWGDKGHYGFLNGGILSLHKPDGKNYHWIISDGDLMGEDWIII